MRLLTNRYVNNFLLTDELPPLLCYSQATCLILSSLNRLAVCGNSGMNASIGRPDTPGGFIISLCEGDS